MARIAQSSIDQVVATADIVDVVSQYTDLRKAGANYSGRCPFHEERSSFFDATPTEKLYYCFGCGAGGNLIGFVMAKENMDFPEAVEYLADRYGIALEYEESSARGDAERRRRERLRALLEDATRYYERVLWTSPAAAPARQISQRPQTRPESASASPKYRRMVNCRHSRLPAYSIMRRSFSSSRSRLASRRSVSIARLSSGRTGWTSSVV